MVRTTPIVPTATSAGLACGVGANMLGRLAFIVPALLIGVGAPQLTLGRYLAYGLVSLGLFMLTRRRTRGQVDRRMWGTAFTFAVAGNVGYYVVLVLGVEYAGAAMTALIVGTLPVTVALYGNWRRREYPFARLAAPIALILLGLLCINLLAPHGEGGAGRAAGAGGTSLVGLLCAFTALALWTWYAVANAAFLRAHPQLSASAWTSLTGVNTLLVVVGVLVVVAVARILGVGASPTPVPWFGHTLWPFLVGSLTLGLGASWAAGVLWNKASTLLPVSLAGQLIVCEPLTVLAYVFLAGSRWPTLGEALGIALVVGGVLLGINATTARE